MRLPPPDLLSLFPLCPPPTTCPRSRLFQKAAAISGRTISDSSNHSERCVVCVCLRRLRRRLQLSSSCRYRRRMGLTHKKYPAKQHRTPTQRHPNGDSKPNKQQQQVERAREREERERERATISGKHCTGKAASHITGPPPPAVQRPLFLLCLWSPRLPAHESHTHKTTAKPSVFHPPSSPSSPLRACIQCTTCFFILLPSPDSTWP